METSCDEEIRSQPLVQTHGIETLMVLWFRLSRYSDSDHYFDIGTERRCCFWSWVGIAICRGRCLYDWHDCICEEKFKGRAEVMEQQNKLWGFTMITDV